MPQVPRRQDSQVPLGGIPSIQPVSAPAEAFGGGPASQALSQAALGLTSDLAKEIQRQQNEADELVVLEADSLIAQKKLSLLNDPQNGALVQRGKASINTADAYGKDLSKFAEDLAKSMNGRQQAALRRRFISHDLDLKSQIEKHTSNEMVRFYNDQTDARLKLSNDEAVSHFNNPALLAQDFATAKAHLDDWARRNTGIPPEAIEIKKRGVISQMHTSVIGKMLSEGMDQQAKGYISAPGILDQMTVKDREIAEKAVKEGTLRGETQREADAIFNPEKKKSEAFEEIRKKHSQDAEYRKMLEDRVELLYRRQDEAARQQIEDDFNSATKALSARPGVRARDAVESSVWARLPRDKQIALDKLSREVENDDSLWVQFNDDRAVGSLSQAEFESKYLAHFDPSHREKAISMWSDMRAAARGDKAKASAVSSLFSDKDLIMNQLRESGIGGIREQDSLADIGKNEGKSKTFRQIADEVDNQFIIMGRQLGRELNGEEKKKVIFGVINNKVKIERKIFKDPEKIVATLSEDEKKKARITIDKIPDSEKMRLLNLARSMGVIRHDTNTEAALRLLQTEMERAYAAQVLLGAGEGEIKSILKGQ